MAILRIRVFGYFIIIIIYFYFWVICFAILLPITIPIWIIWGRKPIDFTLTPFWKLCDKIYYLQ